MKVMSVVGARPNFMKVAPIIKSIQRHNDLVRSGRDEARPQVGPIHHVLVHTGQHYDRLMSDSFFADLEMPAPDVHLGVGSASHAQQTAEIMRKFEQVLLEALPDVLIVVGDVNSTVACALVASKISFDASGTRPLVAHVEAGLRSLDRSMPEEINRILTDQLSDLLFTTEESALHNLMLEGVSADKIHFVGNTMIDSLLAYKHRADASNIREKLGLKTRAEAHLPYALLTLHRPANVDRREPFQEILEGLQRLASDHIVVFPAHPRTQKRIAELGLGDYFSSGHSSRPADALDMVNDAAGIRMVDPLSYLDFLHLMSHARLVVTDSGGIQEETTCLGVPCVTVRDNTERPITIVKGTNILASVRREGIQSAISRQLTSRPSGAIPDKWDGQSADRIVQTISLRFLEISPSISLLGLLPV